MPPKREPFDADHLIQLYTSGLGLKECGDAFGRSESWARDHLIRLGVPMRGRGPQRLPFDEARLIHLYGSGKTLRECGKVFGNGSDWAAKQLRRLGVRIRSSAEMQTAPVDEARLVQLYESGLTFRQCGETVGMSGDWVRKHLRRLGVQPRANSSFDEDRLVALYEAGRSLKACGEAFGHSAGWARRHLKRLGTLTPSSRQPADLIHQPVFDGQRLVDMYNAGASLVRCGQEFNRSGGWARDQLVRLGAPIRKLGETRRKPFDEQRLIDLYQSGASLERCGQEFGRSMSWARENLVRLGIAIRTVGEATHRRGRQRRTVLHAEVEKRWRRGESVLAIAKSLRTSRPVITAVLDDLGLPRRTGSEANVIRFRSDSQRGIATRAAHLSMGSGNADLAEALKNRGVHADRERRVDHLNIDLAIGRFALEVHRTARNPFTPMGRDRERVIHLMDQGFHVAYVWAPANSVTCIFNPGACADDFIAWMQGIGTDPSAESQYRVLRGCGQLTAAGSGYPDELTFKRAPHRHRYPA